VDQEGCLRQGGALVPGGLADQEVDWQVLPNVDWANTEVTDASITAVLPTSMVVFMVGLQSPVASTTLLQRLSPRRWSRSPGRGARSLP
jgi:hypothetical protein